MNDNRCNSHTATVLLAVATLGQWTMVLHHSAFAQASVESLSNAASQPVHLIRMAARERNPGRSSGRISDGMRAIGNDGNLQALDEQGRTVLDWAVIGSNNARRKGHREAYLKLMETLIDAGIDVNAEDSYGLTALDWEEVETDEDFQFLLLEAGARLRASQHETNRLISYVNRLSMLAEENGIDELRRELDPDIPAGTMLPIRLTSVISSARSSGGDAVEAVVIAPVGTAGEVSVGAGLRLDGAVMVASPASDQHQRAELILDFTNLHHTDGATTRLVTRLVSVDNARETVDRGRILGMAFPHGNVSKWNWGLRVLKFSNPIVAQALRTATWGYGKTLNREISYAPGTEMWLQVTVPERVESEAIYSFWPKTEPTPALVNMVQSMPTRVYTPAGVESEITNLMLLGSADQVENAFHKAGWVAAASLNLRTGFKTFQSIVRNKGYDRAPFAALVLEGETPRYEYQKQLNTFAKRHHLRIYERPETFEGRNVWVAAATHDIGIGVERRGTKWYHVIDSRIDREREKIGNDILFTRTAPSYSLVDRPSVPRKGTNGSGDELITDGKMLVLFLED